MKKKRRSPSRRPPAKVRAELAAEVGFGCPVEDCGSPYLTWHHFDPPWSVRKQHDPAGMVAICRDHHSEADAGAFTHDQLREFKRVGRDRRSTLGARFNWMRDDLLAVIGGVFYYDTPIAVQVGSDPVVWFGRDPDGRTLVNLRMLSRSGQPRIRMLDNFWITEGSDERRIVCPPSGREVSARYPNGDALDIRFTTLNSIADLDRIYPARVPEGKAPRSHASDVEGFGIRFPLAAVTITMNVGGTPINFGPTSTSMPGITIGGGWMVGCAVGLHIA
jgi:hypothetical protein